MSIHRIDPVARSAASDPHLLDLHKIYVEQSEPPEGLEGPAVSHKVQVTIVRPEVSAALRAAADWMDEHLDMIIESITVERHYARDEGELNEIRFTVEFR